MLCKATLTAVFSLLAICFQAQVKKAQPAVVKQESRHGLGIGGGITRSVLYLSRNFKENNDATGFNISAVYGISKLLRISAEYTWYRAIDIEPTWFDIHAKTLEANLQIIARFSETKAYFYPLVGLSYNVFSGFFTGVNDFQNLSVRYRHNENAISRWIGLNTGVGYEYFFRKFSFFIEYKMRVGFTEVHRQLNIMDVCISGGLRLNISQRRLNKIFRGTRSRYMLNT